MKTYVNEVALMRAIAMNATDGKQMIVTLAVSEIKSETQIRTRANKVST